MSTEKRFINKHGFVVEMTKSGRWFLKSYMKQKKENRGGTRPGSGRPSLFKEKTKGVKFMCPISKESELKKYVNRKFLEWSRSGI